MRNSDLLAEAILDRLLALGAEESIRQTIDEKLLRAFHAYELRVPSPITRMTFHRTLAEFVLHLYGQGLCIPRRLSPEEALAEALSILEETYREEGGYEVVCWQMVGEGQDALELVLERIGETLRQRQQHQYLQWVFASQIDPLDWQTRHALTRILLHRWKAFLPDSLLQCSPAQLADDYATLILNHLSTENPIPMLCSSLF